jgi:hypothetical protein
MHIIHFFPVFRREMKLEAKSSLLFLTHSPLIPNQIHYSKPYQSCTHINILRGMWAETLRHQTTTQWRYVCKEFDLNLIGEIPSNRSALKRFFPFLDLFPPDL